MKVVLFCGGLGMRLREYSENTPKPMVQIGYRPILWNVMKYYAHYGHKDFILCLGYKADMIKNYFIDYSEYISNDFIYTNGGRDISLLNSDIHDWKITFVDTGLNSNIGERLMAVREFLEDEEMFCANYSDGLTDLYLPDMERDFLTQQDKVACFMAYQPTHSFHVVSLKENGIVRSISPIGDSGLWINAGFLLLRGSIFEYMEHGDELVDQPFKKLIEREKLVSYKHKGFWASMDTFKDKQTLDDLYARGNPPWEVWSEKLKPREICYH